MNEKHSVVRTVFSCYNPPPPLNAMSKNRISAIKKMGGGYTWIKERQVAGKETCR